MDEYEVSDTPTDVYWWLYSSGKKREALQALNADFQLLTAQNNRLASYETYSALYTNRKVDSSSNLLAQYGDMQWAMSKGKYTRCPYNLMKQVIDEATARIVKSHPKAKFITEGGSEKKEHQADLMERWNDHQVHKLYQDETLSSIIGDACLYGIGAMKIGAAHKESRIDTKRVWPGNLFVDLQETRFDQPTRLHHRRFVPKSALKLYFPKMAKEIDAAGTVSDHYASYQWFQQIVDVVEVIESWHLPSFKGAKDGKRFLWVGTTLLQADDYERRDFPFAFFNWKRDPNNRFYGMGLGEDLLGVHIDANVTLNRVNTTVEFASTPHWTYKKGSVTESDITNAPGSKIPYTGDIAPQYVVPNSVPSDLLMYVREHEARAYKIAGLSSAQSFGDRMPSGLETGRAVENFFQVESVPFGEQLQKFQYFVVNMAYCNVATGWEINKRDKGFSVIAPSDKHTIEVVKWDDMALKDPRENSYIIRATPASVLSETFGARLGEVERLAAMDPMMSSADKWDMLQMPDVKRKQDEMTAAKDNGQMMIQKAIDDNVYTPPSPFMDLDQFILDGNNSEQRAMFMGVPEPNIATLRLMLRRANELNQVKKLARDAQAQGMITPAAVPTDETGQSSTAMTPTG